MLSFIESLPALDSETQVGLLLVAFLLLALLAIRLLSRPRPPLRALVLDRATRGLSVPAIARDLALSQDAVRLLLTTSEAARKKEPTGRKYRHEPPVAPQASRRVSLGNRCDVSA